jgi:Domain of unknown function (DUF4263)
MPPRARHRTSLDPSDLYVLAPFQGLTITRELQPNGLHPTEFDLFGDHTADIAIGDSREHQYCFIEFEDATGTSVFKKRAGKTTPEWSDRFDHGCSQIIDWILWLENQRNTLPYIQRFGVGEIQYVGLLVIGRDKFLTDPSLSRRLTWRSEQVIVCSRKLHCITFDKLHKDLDLRLKIWSRR